MITINKAIDASPELRSKKQLIETFIAGINDVDDGQNNTKELQNNEDSSSVASFV